MPVYLHITNLIASKEYIERYYKGGLIAFKKDTKFGSSEADQEDNQLISFVYNEMIEDIFKEGGLTTQHYVYFDRFDGFMWDAEWITQSGSLFAWHKDCSKTLIDKVKEIEGKTMDDIEKDLAKGINHFKTIK